MWQNQPVEMSHLNKTQLLYVTVSGKLLYVTVSGKLLYVTVSGKLLYVTVSGKSCCVDALHHGVFKFWRINGC